MATLKKNGLEENTLVIFFSDNAVLPVLQITVFCAWENPGYMRGGIRENLIARWPAVIKGKCF